MISSMIAASMFLSFRDCSSPPSLDFPGLDAPLEQWECMHTRTLREDPWVLSPSFMFPSTTTQAALPRDRQSKRGAMLVNRK